MEKKSELFESAKKTYLSFKKDYDKLSDKNCERALLLKNSMFALEGQFPHLKEGEDERIREALIRFHKGTIDIDGIKGEQKTTEEIELKC